MNFKGVDIGCLHDPLRYFVKPFPAQGTRTETLNMSSFDHEVTIEYTAFAYDLDPSGSGLKSNEDRRAIPVQNRDLRHDLLR
jgi:hypothetical protein